MFEFPHLLMETLFFLEDLTSFVAVLSWGHSVSYPKKYGVWKQREHSHCNFQISWEPILCVHHTLPFFADNFSPVQSPQVIKPLSTVIKSPFLHPLILDWPCKFFGQSNEPERTSSCYWTEILRSLAAFFVSLSEHFYLWTDWVELMGDGDHVEQK